MQTTRADAPTTGLEEELHIVDAGSGTLASRAPELLRALELPDRRLFDGAGAVVPELTLSQVETVTSVASSTEELLTKALTLRAAVASAASELGLCLLASGTPVLGAVGEQAVAGDQRYAGLVARGAALAAAQLIAGMHVHVGVSGSLPGGVSGPVHDASADNARVAVVDYLRPWLPTLLAITANSPYWLGEDTGFASYRHVHWQRWPVAGPPPQTGDGAGWRRAVDAVVAAGVVDDPSYVYWDVRLATRFPTVEVRVADVVPTLEDAALFVGLVRALTVCAVEQVDGPGRQPTLPLHALRAAMWRAARYGLEDRLVNPLTGALEPAADVVAALHRCARPGLAATGDDDVVQQCLLRLSRDGNGAMRQRRAFARAGWAGVLDVVRVQPNALPFHPAKGDGNGWVDCTCGRRHWGLHGAAGLLVVRAGQAEPQVLLQLRADWTHEGGTWGLPGGARDSHESPGDAARREASEETDLDVTGLQDMFETSDEHGVWRYTYVVVRTFQATAVAAVNQESVRVVWVGLDDVADLRLHPGLAAAWPQLRTRLARACSRNVLSDS